MVFVSVGILFPTPFTRRSNSFASAVCQTSFSAVLIRWRYSYDAPVFESMTEAIWCTTTLIRCAASCFNAIFCCWRNFGEYNEWNPFVFRFEILIGTIFGTCWHCFGSFVAIGFVIGLESGSTCTGGRAVFGVEVDLMLSIGAWTTDGTMLIVCLETV